MFSKLFSACGFIWDPKKSPYFFSKQTNLWFAIGINHCLVMFWVMILSPSIFCPKKDTTKSQALAPLVYKHYSAFTDCLWRGNRYLFPMTFWIKLISYFKACVDNCGFTLFIWSKYQVGKPSSLPMNRNWFICWG